MRRPRGLMDSVISSRFDHKLLDHFSPYFAAVQSFKFYAYLRVNTSINVPCCYQPTNNPNPAYILLGKVIIIKYNKNYFRHFQIIQQIAFCSLSKVF